MFRIRVWMCCKCKYVNIRIYSNNIHKYILFSTYLCTSIKMTTRNNLVIKDIGEIFALALGDYFMLKFIGQKYGIEFKDMVNETEGIRQQLIAKKRKLI